MRDARNYADSHPIVRVSTKRLAASPFLDRYATDDAMFGVYGGRLYALSLGDDPIEGYWRLRRGAALFDVPERPLQVEGPDAARLLNLVLTRDVATLEPGRAGYGIACDARGGILMDGVLMRLAPDRFWYVLADGDFVGWLEAHAIGLDVTIADPGSWVLQVQGPASLDVLAAACDASAPEPFGYFAVAETRIADQPVIVSRTGWSAELGFEVYTLPGIDAGALWERLLAAGEPHGLAVQSLESLGIRRIEAGILDNGTDMGPHTTPFAAGLGRFVDLEKENFIGRDALAGADRRPRIFGISGEGVPVPGTDVFHERSVAGRVTAGAWSPFLERGIGYALMHEPGAWAGRSVRLAGDDASSDLVELPFYDPERAIPRGAPSDESSA
ncbi:MAG: aminomethyltransferase family protein [Actinomycetota bacterium]|nr:aminomethyltransferase family protein [Actinomycetota bacterium]